MSSASLPQLSTSISNVALVHRREDTRDNSRPTKRVYGRNTSRAVLSIRHSIGTCLGPTRFWGPTKRAKFKILFQFIITAFEWPERLKSYCD